MYQVGANNPNAGNDRRKQLLDTLFQQLQQRRAQQQQVGQPATGSFDFLKKRSQSLLPSTPTQAAGSGRDTSGSVMTQGTNIPGAVHDALGPGGNSRADSSGGLALMPGHSAGYASPGGMSSPIPGGSMIGAPPAPPAITAPAPGTWGQVSPDHAALPAGAMGYDTVMAHAPAQSGLVPLGNGMFFDPSTGALHGMPNGVLGGAAKGIGG